MNKAKLLANASIPAIVIPAIVRRVNNYYEFQVEQHILQQEMLKH